MRKEELLDKLNAIEEVAPDPIDLASLKEAEEVNDGESMPLDEVKSALDFSGKLNIRIPKSLHQRLSIEAKKDGVSLNQYIVYKLAQ